MTHPIWQIWIDGQPVGAPTSWENAAKWTAVLQGHFRPNHRVGCLPHMQEHGASIKIEGMDREALRARYHYLWTLANSDVVAMLKGQLSKKEYFERHSSQQAERELLELRAAAIKKSAGQ